MLEHADSVYAHCGCQSDPSCTASFLLQKQPNLLNEVLYFLKLNEGITPSSGKKINDTSKSRGILDRGFFDL